MNTFPRIWSQEDQGESARKHWQWRNSTPVKQILQLDEWILNGREVNEQIVVTVNDKKFRQENTKEPAVKRKVELSCGATEI